MWQLRACVIRGPFHQRGNQSMKEQVLGALFVGLAWAGFGSFAVPIKTPSVIKANCDPVVFQTFKTTAVRLFGGNP